MTCLSQYGPYAIAYEPYGPDSSGIDLYPYELLSYSTQNTKKISYCFLFFNINHQTLLNNPPPTPF
jgi:hypothetical protein